MDPLMVSLHGLVVPLIFANVMTASASVADVGRIYVSQEELSEDWGFTELVGQAVGQLVELHEDCHLEFLSTAPHSPLASSIIR